MTFHFERQAVWLLSAWRFSPHRGVAFGALLVATVLCVTPAVAQERTDPIAADYMFREARKAAATGNYKKACPMFAESLRLEPGAGARMNLADCEEHIGQIASAWEHWRGAIDDLRGKVDSRAAIAKRHVAALEKRLPRLTLKLEAGTPEGAKVERDGVEIGTATLGLPIPVNPGSHAIVVSAPRHEDKSYTVEMKEAQVTEMVVGLGAAIPDPPPPEPLAPKVVIVPAKPSSTKTIGFVLIGVGGVGVAVGAVAGLLAIGKKNAVQERCSADPSGGVVCPDADGLNAASSGRTMATISTVGFAVGAVAVAVGAYFVFTSHDGGKAVTALAPGALPGGGMMTMVRTF